MMCICFLLLFNPTQAAIRKYLIVHYKCTEGTRFNLFVRRAIEAEWEKGTIVHFNYDQDQINFSKRFALPKEPSNK